VVEHNAGDLTAVLQAGVPLATAQETFAAAGQMLALDPPLRGPDPAGGAAATVGGVVASGDSGPLRHRYGAARELLLGIAVALSAAALMKGCGLDAGLVEGDDAGLWERQRSRQRSVSGPPDGPPGGSPGGSLGGSGAIVRVSGLPAELAKVIRAAERAGGTLVGRAGLGLSWIELPSVAGAEELAGRIGEVRRELAPWACTVLDAP